MRAAEANREPADAAKVTGNVRRQARSPMIGSLSAPLSFDIIKVQDPQIRLRTACRKFVVKLSGTNTRPFNPFVRWRKPIRVLTIEHCLIQRLPELLSSKGNAAIEGNR